MITRFTTLGAAFAFSMAGAAHAAPVDVNIGIGTMTLTATDQGAADVASLGAGYNGTTPAGATWSADDAPAETIDPNTGPVVQDGSSNNQHRSPFLGTSLDGTSYFSVGPYAVDPDTGEASTASPITLTFDAMQTDFSFIWGSVDTYNTFELLDDEGQPILIPITGPGALGFAIDGFDEDGPNFEKWLLVELAFNEGSGFNGIRFSSQNDSGREIAAMEFAFRSGDVSGIPVPAAVWLMLTGIAGLGFVGRTRRTA